jgi:hypothetical protein
VGAASRGIRVVSGAEPLGMKHLAEGNGSRIQRCSTEDCAEVSVFVVDSRLGVLFSLLMIDSGLSDGELVELGVRYLGVSVAL